MAAEAELKAEAAMAADAEPDMTTTPASRRRIMAELARRKKVKADLDALDELASLAGKAKNKEEFEELQVRFEAKLQSMGELFK
jgi:hypothetical protein